MIRTALRFGAPLACVLMSAEAAFAADKPTIDTGDTAWLLVATCLVLMMNIPGLALPDHEPLQAPVLKVQCYPERLSVLA